VTAAATYCYCLVRGTPAPVMAKVPRGLPGLGRPRLVAVGEGLWLVAADAPLPLYAAGEIEGRLTDLEWVSARAIAHDAVVEHFAGRSTVVPMKLFTLFTTDDRARASIARRRRALDRLFARLEGREEWGVRLAVDLGRARLATGAARTAAAAPSGTAFLLRKQQQRATRRDALAGAGRTASRVFAVLARHADAARRQPLVGGNGVSRLVLDAAFLVPVGARRRWRADIGRLARELRPQGYDLRLTGPWPPYSFAGGAR
jgi:hypothetical protein